MGLPLGLGGLFGDHFKFRSGGVVASVLCAEAMKGCSGL